MPKRKDSLPEFEAPIKSIFTDHDMEVKCLLQKQTNVKINLQEELQKPKTFESSMELTPLSTHVSGRMSLKYLKDEEKRMEKVHRLENCGLSQTDIHLYFDYINEGFEYCKSKFPNHEPSLLMSKIEVLLKITNEHDETKANVNDKATNTHSSHPMNNIKEIESNFMHSLTSTSFNKDSLNINQIRRKARKVNQRLERIPTCTSTASASCTEISSSNKPANSLWDETELAAVSHQSKLPCFTTNNDFKKKEYTCQKQNLYTIKNGKIVHVESPKKSEGSEIRISGRMPLEDILKLAHFGNYTPGTPSKLIETNESAPNHIERVYCGHLFHLNCLHEYMKKPPFGNKRCQSCSQPIHHHKWSLSEKLAEDRWAHEQARERELTEVEDFFK